MTGFGRSEGNCCGIIFRIEVRSVNHKYCDTNVRLPDELARLEQKIRSAITSRFSRGKFDISIFQIDTSLKDRRPSLKISTIKQYQAILKELSRVLNTSFSIKNDISWSDMIALKEIAAFSRIDYDNTEIDKPLLKIVGKSLDGLMNMRLKEGHAIYKDLNQRINRLESMISRIKRHVPKVILDMRKRYLERIKEISGVSHLDMDRLCQEIAVMIERMDITEEIVRAGSHISQLKNKLDEGGVIGRTLDFLLQEINREVNTIGSKASDVKISQMVVDMKAELERIREQVQNIE